MDTREIFKSNLNHYIDLSGKSKKVISEEMNIPYTTLVDWANGNKFPRADGIERLANYFKILKSNLLEEQNTTASNFENALRFALFGGDAEYISDEAFEDVKRFAQIVAEKEKAKRNGK